MKLLTSFLAAWMFWYPAIAYSIPLHVFLGGTSTPAANDYTPYGAVFDGTSDYLQFTHATDTLAGLSDSKTWTCSFWVKFNGGDGASQYVWEISTNSSGSNQRLRIRRLNTNKITVRAYNSSAVEILQIASGTSVTVSSGMTHVLIVVNSNAASKYNKIYINGALESLTTTVALPDDATFDLAAGGGSTREYTIGATGADASLLNADLFDFWFDDSAVDDVSKFYNAGQPVDLGADGSTPTGSPPAVYLSRAGSGDTWNTNSSGGSSFTLNGSLGTPSTFP